MAKWISKTNDFGNDYATYNDGVIKGYLEDCDGDSVSWSVYRINPREEISSGDVLVVGDTMQSEVDAWEEAKRLANIAICMAPRNVIPPFEGDVRKTLTRMVIRNI